MHGQATIRGNPQQTDESRWAQTPLQDRLRWLQGFRLRLFDATDELCELMLNEVNKPFHEALTGDLLPLLASVKWHERYAQRLLRTKRPMGTPIWMLGQRHRIVRVPLGHVGIIATWNYPVQLLGIQLVQALVAGNRVTVKPSERSPKTQARLVSIAQVGLPDETLNLYSSGREAGARMLSEERFDHVVFTGSTQVGRSIAEVLATTLTPSTLELSGRDSVLVLHDADPKLAAASVWNMVSMNCGQTCMAPRRVLVHSVVYDAFCEHLRQHAAGSTPRRIIDSASGDRVRQLAREAQSQGAELVPSLETSSDEAPGDDRSVIPRLALGAAPSSRLAEGDHFGPLAAAIRCESLEEMLEIHKKCHQHLATSVFTADLRAAERLARELGAGSVAVNEVVMPTAHPGCSIQGRQESGWGTSRGEEGLLAMTRGIHLAKVPKRPRVPVGEPDEKAIRQLRGFMKLLYGRGRRP
jgi:aldehyde dehydrogenase (NAD+)